MLFGHSDARRCGRGRWRLMQTGIKAMGSANKDREVPDVTFNPQNVYHGQDLFGATCVEGLIFEEAHVASFSPASELANGG